MKYFFRTNLGPNFGLGHFNRIQFFVHLLKKKNCTIVIDKKEKEFFNKIKRLNIKEIYKDSEFNDEGDDAIKFKKILKNNKQSFVIVDDYRLGYHWEKYISNYCRKIISIDDYINRKHYSDIYINTKPNLINPSKSVKNILKRNNKKDCTFLLGPKYCLINPNLKKQKRSVKNFSISFYNGGSGSLLIYEKIIIELLKKKIKNFKINLIFGPLNRDQKIMINKFKDNKYVNIVYNKNNLSEVLSNTDLLIASAGVIIFEAAFFKIPTILINMHQNQKVGIESLEKIGHYLFLNKKDLKKTKKFSNLIKIVLAKYERINKLFKKPEIKIKRNYKLISKSLKI